MSDAVLQSYRWCRQVAKQSGSNFYRSFALLEPKRRRAMEALYAFSRLTDDISDDSDDKAESTSLKQSRLALWREQLDALDGSTSTASSITPPFFNNIQASSTLLWPALQDTLQQFQIPKSLLLDLVDGVAMDLESPRFANENEADRYCYCVASTVGLACLHIWGAPMEKVRSWGIDCGIAFQWTNILRDVREDAGRGRIYFPLDQLAKFGCSQTAWLECRPDGDINALIHETIARVEKLYRSGWQIEATLQGNSRMMFSLMFRTYYRLLQTIAANRSAIWQRRLRVSTREKLRLSCMHFIPGVRRLLPSPFPAAEISEKENRACPQ